MGIKSVERKDLEVKYADPTKLKPGDTFEQAKNRGNFFLVTSRENEDEGMTWEVIELTTGNITLIEDDENLILVDLIMSKEK